MSISTKDDSNRAYVLVLKFNITYVPCVIGTETSVLLMGLMKARKTYLNGRSSVMWDIMVSPDVRHCYLCGTPTPPIPTRTKLMDSDTGVNSNPAQRQQLQVTVSTFHYCAVQSASQGCAYYEEA